MIVGWLDISHLKIHLKIQRVKRQSADAATLVTAGDIGNVYNIIENISPIHFWHHYLWWSDDNLRAAAVRPSLPPRGCDGASERAAVARVLAYRLVVSVLRACPPPAQGYEENSLLAGFRTDVMRLALAIGMRASCQRDRRLYVALQWNLWTASDNLDCSVGS